MKIKKFGKFFFSEEQDTYVTQDFIFVAESKYEDEACKDHNMKILLTLSAIRDHLSALVNDMQRDINKAPARSSEDFSVKLKGNTKSAEEIVSESLLRIMTKP